MAPTLVVHLLATLVLATLRPATLVRLTPMAPTLALHPLAILAPTLAPHLLAILALPMHTAPTLALHLLAILALLLATLVPLPVTRPLATLGRLRAAISSKRGLRFEWASFS